MICKFIYAIRYRSKKMETVWIFLSHFGNYFMSSISLGHPNAASINYQRSDHTSRRYYQHRNFLCTQSKKRYRLRLYGHKISVTDEYYQSRRKHSDGSNGSIYAHSNGKYHYGASANNDNYFSTTNKHMSKLSLKK